MKRGAIGSFPISSTLSYLLMCPHMAAVDGTSVYIHSTGHGFPVVYRQASIICWLYVVIDGVDGGGLTRGGGGGVGGGGVCGGGGRGEVGHSGGGIDLCSGVRNGVGCGGGGVGKAGVRYGLGVMLGGKCWLGLLWKHLWGWLGDYRLGHGLGGLGGGHGGVLRTMGRVIVLRMLRAIG